mmetsp:Transcript_29923/g.63024  ORF Transcript_29923/g.63024 Transcript_29923/m.63024 type:complete len:216 (-) Transcript_29923:21-668(-)
MMQKCQCDGQISSRQRCPPSNDADSAMSLQSGGKFAHCRINLFGISRTQRRTELAALVLQPIVHLRRHIVRAFRGVVCKGQRLDDSVAPKGHCGTRARGIAVQQRRSVQKRQIGRGPAGHQWRAVKDGCHARLEGARVAGPPGGDIGQSMHGIGGFALLGSRSRGRGGGGGAAARSGAAGRGCASAVCRLAASGLGGFGGLPLLLLCELFELVLG